MGFLLEVAGHEAVIPAWVFGVVACVLLLGALACVRNVGKSRPHS